MGSNDLSAKKGVPFLYTWKLEELLSSADGSRREFFHSDVFVAGGYHWKLLLRLGEPKAKNGTSYLFLFLALADGSTLPPQLVVEVIQESSLLEENYSQHNKRKVVRRLRESKKEVSYPFNLFLEALTCPPSGFIVVEIIDVIVHPEEKESFSPMLKKNPLAHIWKIEGFSKLTKQSYNSAPFLYKDHIWYLTLHPKGTKEDKFISLYLNLDDSSTLPSSVNIRVEYYLECVNQINGKNHGYKSSHDFNSKSPGWGYKRFLCLDVLRESSKGFLVNDTCTIKVTFLN